MPNQLGIDRFDLADALGEGREHLCSSDLRDWMAEHHLDLTVRAAGESPDVFNPREAFGSSSDSDRVYNTPRSWAMQRYLNPHACVWDGPHADLGPESSDIPWARRPERLLTIEDVKYVLSMHYQGTPYDCYGKLGTPETRGSYRPIGVNRTSHLAVLQLRPYAPEGCRGIQWMAYGCNVFNALVALYAGVRTMPAYIAQTGEQVSTDSFYWANRLVAALADPHFSACIMDVERYQQKIGSLGHAMLVATNRQVAQAGDADVMGILEQANEQLVADLRRETDQLLGRVLYASSMGMKSAFARSDG
jgi:dipeptidase